MIVTVFRSRLNPDVGEEYTEMAVRMSELAKTMPGYISHKSFTQRMARGSPSSSSRRWRGNSSGAGMPSMAMRCGSDGPHSTRNSRFRSARQYA